MSRKYWIAVLLLTLVACKESYEVKPATYSLRLTGDESKSWQQVSFTFNFDDEDVPDMDAYDIYGIPPCERDDIYKYIREGKQVEVYNGEIKCNPEGDDLLFKSTWDIINSNATLFIGSSDPFELGVLTDDSLVYGFRDTLVAPIGESTFWEFPGIAQWVYKPKR